MGSLDTKLLIVDSLLGLTSHMPLEKISVSDIVEASGKNRKTFYYHFTDKNYLLAWIFRYDMGSRLAAECTPDQLVYARGADEATDEFPYYTFIKDGVRSVDGTPFVRALSATLQGRRSFYAQALIPRTPDSLWVYLHDLYVPAMRRDTEFILSNRFLGEAQVDFLAEYSFNALLGYLASRLEARGQGDLLKDIGPFGNIVHATIADAITRHQMGRA